jgi:hypothetical protein
MRTFNLEFEVWDFRKKILKFLSINLNSEFKLMDKNSDPRSHINIKIYVRDIRHGNRIHTSKLIDLSLNSLLEAG